jgi:hypothetical protein
MVVNGRPLKRMKRRVTADLHDFLNFPSSSSVAGKDGVSDGPFRTRVSDFLAKHALLPPPSSLFPHLLTWQMLFRVGDATDGPDSIPDLVCLDVVEEDVARSRNVYCDQCRVVGESHSPTHFIDSLSLSHSFLFLFNISWSYRKTRRLLVLNKRRILK